jgi:hypothetical protein
MTAPTVVQFKFPDFGTTFDMNSTPTVGNLLVLCRSMNNSYASQSGFTDQLVKTAGTGGTQTWISVSTRVVQAGGAPPDNGHIVDASSGHTAWFIWEFANGTFDQVVGIDNVANSFNAPGPDPRHQTAGGALTPSTGAPIIIIGFAGMRTTGSGSDLVHSSTPDAGWTQDFFAADNPDGNIPEPIIVSQAVSSPSGSYTAGSQFTMTGASNGVPYIGITFSIAGSVTPGANNNSRGVFVN